MAKVNPRVKANVNWKLDVAYHRRKGKGDVEGEDGRSFSKTLPAIRNGTYRTNSEMNFVEEAQRCLTESVTCMSVISVSLGKNPADSAAKSYIQCRQGIHFYAWAIAQEESRQGSETYNQFNTRGSRAEEPDFGIPDGWGIFQSDPSGDGMETTTELTHTTPVEYSTQRTRKGNGGSSFRIRKTMSTKSSMRSTKALPEAREKHGQRSSMFL